MKAKLKENKKLLIFFVILLPLYLISILFASSFVLSFIKTKQLGINIVMEYIKTNPNNTLIYIELIALAIYIIFATWKLLSIKNKSFSNDSKSKTYGSARWLTEKEIAKNYIKVDMTNPGKNYGVVVRSEEIKKGKVFVNIRNEAHTMIIAGTRVGKTQGFVKPTLHVMAHSSVKPSLCISDPKGELYAEDSLMFQNNGYKVIKLDLRNPEYSYSWNVLSNAFINWERYCMLEAEELETKKDLQSYLFKQKAFGYINDICETLFFSTNEKDAFWNNGARDITKGILISILYEMKENKCLDINKFNMAEIIPIVNNVNSLKQYFESLPPTHPARIAAGSINASENALNDVISTLKIKLSKFGDSIIRNIITKNEIDLSNISSQPTVFFIVSPDERRDMDIFVSLFVTQLYKILVEETDKSNGKLERPFYFILDEFPTLQIPDMDRKMSISGGRNIWFMLIIQSKTQLEINYRNMSKVIFDNCHMHIVIQTMDTETAKFYNQFIGKKTIISHSYSDKNKSSTEKGIDLFGTDELLKMPPNEAIVIYTKENPMKTKFIPMWKVESYVTGMVPNIINIPTTDQEFTSKYFFDLTSFSKNNVVNDSVSLNEVSEELNTSSLISQKNELFELLDELIEEEKFHSTRELKEEISKIRIEIDDINLAIKRSILNSQNKSNEINE